MSTDILGTTGTQASFLEMYVDRIPDYSVKELRLQFMKISNEKFLL